MPHHHESDGVVELVPLMGAMRKRIHFVRGLIAVRRGARRKDTLVPSVALSPNGALAEREQEVGQDGHQGDWQE